MAENKNDRPFQGLDEFFAYKNQLLEDVLTNEKIFDLLNDRGVYGAPEEMIGKCVFPYEYLPTPDASPVENAQTFLCCDVDIQKAFAISTYLTATLYVWVFTHDVLMPAPGGGVRTDIIASEISKKLNGSYDYGLGRLDLDYVKRISPIQRYQGRVLRFITSDWNRLNPTGQKPPANRSH